VSGAIGSVTGLKRGGRSVAEVRLLMRCAVFTACTIRGGCTVHSANLPLAMQELLTSYVSRQHVSHPSPGLLLTCTPPRNPRCGKPHSVPLLLQVPVGEGGTTAWKTCVLTPSSTVTLYLDVSAPHAVRAWSLISERNPGVVTNRWCSCTVS
jgi:hypothetical protein